MNCSYEEHASPVLFFEQRAVDGVIMVVWRLAMWLLLCSIAVMLGLSGGGRSCACMCASYGGWLLSRRIF
jgi:hypothetical protein